ncbi:MAG: hypothetical protein J6C82_04945 [Clostridia bacterium]|nr:hypothetical protein [Clostridia bacterium]
MYLTYERYSYLGGVCPDTAFLTLGFRAEQIIKAQTHNRITVVNETIERCITEVTNLLYKAEEDNRVSSFSHDGLSESYSVIDASEYQKKISDIIYTYLIHEYAEDGTPLLYMGVKGHG